MNFFKNKGQVGIFIAIGTILVIGFIFLISTNFDDIPIFSDEKTTYNVKEFVESCLLLQTETAIDNLGASGGWLYPKPMMYATRDQNKLINKVATGFDFLEINEMPYWYYYDDTDEVFRTYIPEYDSDSPTSIKSQIEKYINENLESQCFNGFRNFKDIYNVKYDSSDVETSVRMLDNKIIVDLDLEFEVEDIVTNTTDYLSSFRVDTVNKLYLPYNLAKEIVKAEVNSSFMDTRVIQLLSGYQSVDGRDLLPPESETTLDYDMEAWRMEDVEKLAKQIISSEISRVQFLNTHVQTREVPESLKNNRFVQAVNSQYEADYLTENTDLDEKNPKLFEQFKDLKVTPTYEPFFPTFFKIKQALGDLILLPKPEMVAGFLPIFYTHYKASYEITAPVVFEIRTLDKNDNFVFNLPIEINVKHNTALKKNYEVSRVFTDELPKPQKTLICDQSQFISDVVSVKLEDPIFYGDRESRFDFKRGVDDAIVEFTCKDLVTCYVTKTDFGGNESVPDDLEDTVTELKFRLPVDCNPGKLEITKFGHQKVIIDGLNPQPALPIDLGVQQMSSAKTLKVNTGLQKVGTGTFGGIRTLQPEDSAFVVFENLDDEDLIKVIQIDSENQYNLSIDLVPGNYKIHGLVIYEKEIKIPSEKICWSTGIFSGDECETLPAMDLGSWLKGGIQIDQFEVTVDELLTSNTLQITFLEFELPKTYGELEKASEQMSNLQSGSQFPRFSFEE